jgi:hypothetical protein
MAESQPRGQAPPAPRDGMDPTRVGRAQNTAGENNNNDRSVANTPAKEDEGLIALHQLGCNLQLLWEMAEREGGATVSPSDLTSLMELHQKATRGLARASAVENRLDSIEKQIRTMTEKLPMTTSKQLPSWAAVAAAPQPPARFGSTIVKTNAITIRPQESGYKGQTPAEVLQRVRAIIPGAVAAQPLRSGDVRITMASTQQKEATLNNGDSIGQAIGAKVLRQDYPVEVQAVPTSIAVEHGRSAENTKTIREMVEGTRRLIPSFTATRIAWIHGKESVTPRKGETRAPRHASLIVYVPSAEIQKKAVQHGIIIEGVIYPTRLYDSALQRTRCFKCNRWGHTQASCQAKATCGHCAGQHDTRECTKKDDPSTARCCNCGKGGHRSWQTSKCPDYRRRCVQLEERRRAMDNISLNWKAERDYQVPLCGPMMPPTAHTPTNEVASGRKRERPQQQETSDDGSRRRGLGRPPKAIQPDPRQPSLEDFTRRAEPQCMDLVLATEPLEGTHHMETTQDLTLSQ